jgi:nucleoside-diphosphate-sugar epimerase
VLAALDRPSVTGPFNVCNDGVITQREFLAHFAQGLGVRLRVIPVPRALAWNAARLADLVLRRIRPGSPMTMLKAAVQFLSNANPYVSDKARRELGWTPALAPADAVERTARWFAA